MKLTLKGLKFVLTACFSFFIGMYVHAQDENGLCLHYNFEGVKGTSVPDASGSGATATLKNQAQIVEMGKYHVLDLGNGSGYLDMGQAAGEIFRQNNAYTISMYYRVDDAASLSGAGFFLWNFSTSASCDASNGKYSAYRLNAQRIANSTGRFQQRNRCGNRQPVAKRQMDSCTVQAKQYHRGLVHQRHIGSLTDVHDSQHDKLYHKRTLRMDRTSAVLCRQLSAQHFGIRHPPVQQSSDQG